MIRHLFTLVWNRKQTNVLIVAEVLISFLVVCAVLTLGMHYLTNYLKPLGFEYRDVWNVDVFTGGGWSQQDEAGVMNTTRELAETVRNQPEVIEVAGVLITPFGYSTWLTTLRDGTVEVMYEQATDELPDVLHIITPEPYRQKTGAANSKVTVLS